MSTCLGKFHAGHRGGKGGSGLRGDPGSQMKREKRPAIKRTNSERARPPQSLTFILPRKTRTWGWIVTAAGGASRGYRSLL